MSDEDKQQGLLGMTAAQITQAAESAYARLRELLAKGVSPRDAITQAMRSFRGPYYEILSDAFSQILQRTVGVAEVKRWPVADVTLSRRLYHHQQRAEAATMGVLRAHQKGTADARQLALDLYEGYGFKPREVLDIKAKLPKYMRKDTLLSGEYSRMIAKFNSASLKTPALKAAYLQAIDAIEIGAGQAALDKRLKVAFQERNRYFGNRIAQTELQRAYAAKKDGGMLDDPNIEFVRWELSSSHPQVDICDLHANLDKYGLGRGVYPKHLAPTRPAHPFCRCTLTPVLALTGSTWRERAGAERQYLRELSNREGASVIGSREKLQQMLDGAGLAAVINRGVPEGYGFERLGDMRDRLKGKIEG